MTSGDRLSIVATIEARMTSSRLPGKVLLPAGGKPMLQHLVERLRRVKSLDRIVLATTDRHTDDELAAFARRQEIACFRGSEDDVMGRVLGAAESVAADVVVEITGDCPIIDPDIVEETIQLFLRSGCDYASNNYAPSYPDGMDTQVFAVATLRRSAAMTQDVLDREHVTLHIRRHPELFSHAELVAPAELNWPELGLTLDEPRDYELLKRVIDHFADVNPWFGCRDVVAFLRSKPEWVVINQDVRRKGAA